MLSLGLCCVGVAAVFCPMILAGADPESAAKAQFDVSDKYIVTLKPGIDEASHVRLVNIHINATAGNDNSTVFAGVGRKYAVGNFRGYAGHFHKSVVERLRVDKDVESVEADQMWHEGSSKEEPCGSDCDAGHDSTQVDYGQVIGGGPGKNTKRQQRGLVYQTCASYNLRLISHREAGKWTYWYDRSAGAGTYAYVIDGGVHAKHYDFGTRATLGYNAWGLGTTDEDTTGSGTHTAGIIGGKKNGVAKKCQLVAVKVTKDGGTTTEILLDGYKWAANDIIRKRRQSKAVIHISLYSRSISEPFAQMVKAAFGQGVVTVVAAGNGGDDARLFSPANADAAITVGATDRNRVRVSHSNFGPAIDIWAPGEAVCSASIRGGSSTGKRSGTAQAAAHVAGLVVYLKGLSDLGDARATVLRLNRLGSLGLVGNTKGSKNLFAYNGSGK